MSEINSDNWMTKEIVTKIDPPQPFNINEEFASLKLTTLPQRVKRRWSVLVQQIEIMEGWGGIERRMK